MLTRLFGLFLKRDTWVRWATRVHVAFYRLSGGTMGGLLSGLPILLLTTRGRKTGLPRTTPLCYLPDGASFVVVASYGGSPMDPGWWRNLQANPEGCVEVGSRRFEVRANQADPELKQRLWPIFARHYPAYNDYQARTDRIIPLVVLDPTS